MDYAICIKRTVGYCGLTLSVSTEGDGFGLNSNEIGLNTGLSCHAFDFTQRVQDNSSDFLQLNGAFVSDGINRRPDAYFCGVYDNTVTDQFLPISSKT